MNKITLILVLFVTLLTSRITAEPPKTASNGDSIASLRQEISSLSRRIQFFESRNYLSQVVKGIEGSGKFFSQGGKFFTTSTLGLFGGELQIGLSRSAVDSGNTTKILLLGQNEQVVFQVDASGRIRAAGFEGDGSKLRDLSIQSIKGLDKILAKLKDIEESRNLPLSYLEERLSTEASNKIPSSKAVSAFVDAKISKMEAGLNLVYEPRNKVITEHVYQQQGNPHKVTSADVGLSEVANVNVLKGFTQMPGGRISTPEIAAIDRNGLNLRDQAGNGIHVHDGGFVGVGTNHPTHRLEVSGTGDSISTAAIGIFQGSGRGVASLRLRNQSQGGRTLTIGLGGPGAPDHPNSLYITDDTAASNRVVLDSKGRVGIGIQNPDELLDVGGVVKAHSLDISGNVKASSITLSGGIKAANLGTISSQDAQEVQIAGGSIRGIQDLAIEDGGTGASNVAQVLKNLGIEIGKDVQAYHRVLEKLANQRPLKEAIIFDSADGPFHRDVAQTRKYLGMGTLGEQNADNVLITGGKIQGSSLDGVLIGENFPAFATFTHVSAKNGIMGQIQTEDQPKIKSLGALKSLDIIGEVKVGNDRFQINPKGSKISMGTAENQVDVTVNGSLKSNELQVEKRLATGELIVYGDIKAKNLGTLATQDSSKVLIEGGRISGIEDISIKDGGTGASQPEAARKNLGLEIGKNVQPFHPNLSAIAALPPLNDHFLLRSGSRVQAVNPSEAQKILGLGNLAFQQSASVQISGGVVTSVNIDASAIGFRVPAPAKFTRAEVLGGIYGSIKTPHQPSITRLGMLDSLQVRDSFEAGNKSLMVSSSTGRVGIGTTSPQDLLHVAGTLRVRKICNESGNVCIDATKDLPVPKIHGEGAFLGAEGSPSEQEGNEASGRISSLVGGSANLVSAESGFLGGGYRNKVTGSGGVVVGGNANTASGVRSFVGGGNVNNSSGELSAIVGGNLNTASGTKSTVGGGNVNVASGANSVVAGGQSNKALGQNSSIGGGSLNLARANNSTVSGGTGNSATGEGAVVSGGFQNEARGDYSIITGGRSLILEGSGAFGFNGTNEKITIPKEVTSSALFFVNSFGIGVRKPEALLHVYDDKTSSMGFIRASNFNPIPFESWPSFETVSPFLLQSALWVGWDSLNKVWKYNRMLSSDRGTIDPGNPSTWMVNGKNIAYFDGNLTELPSGTHINNRYNPRMPAARCDQDDIQIRIGSFWVDKYPAVIIDVGRNFSQATLLDDTEAMHSSGNDQVSTSWMAFSQRRRGSTGMTWFVAVQVAANAGKHLLDNLQWQTAAMGTQRSSGNKMVDGNDWKVISAVDFSRYGVVGMAGNLWEWVGNWGQYGRDMAISRGEGLDAWGVNYGSDFTYNLNGKAFTNDRSSWVTGLPGALHRGGYWAHGDTAGIFALAADAAPSRWETTIGFRAGR